MEKEIKCRICGKTFIAKRAGTKYCSKECFRKGQAEWARIAREKSKVDKSPRNVTLANLANEATKAGLSYGQYVLKMEEEMARKKKVEEAVVELAETKEAMAEERREEEKPKKAEPKLEKLKVGETLTCWRCTVCGQTYWQKPKKCEKCGEKFE